MRRGDIWTVGCGKDYAGKPRPAVIVQDDSFDATDSIIVDRITTVPKSKVGARIGVWMMRTFCASIRRSSCSLGWQCLQG